jgi:hypothetical protein
MRGLVLISRLDYNKNYKPNNCNKVCKANDYEVENKLAFF